jgi:hypothetical protein
VCELDVADSHWGLDVFSCGMEKEIIADRVLVRKSEGNNNLEG